MLLIQALLPSLIQAAPNSGSLVEICTAFGIKKTTVSEDGSSSFSSNPCPICNFADAFALPDAAPAMHAPTGIARACIAPISTGYSPHPILSLHLRGPPATL
nr:hypothetical protein [Noviherbaspirillum saxi]